MTKGSVKKKGNGQDSSLDAVSIENVHRFYFNNFILEENLALLKPATQSDVLWSYRPDLAVDGDPNTCSFTTRKEGQRWWQVQYNLFIHLISCTKIT